MPVQSLTPESCKLRFTLEQIQEAEDQNLGYCTVCGETRDGCEPDAEDYECEACGESAVYGPHWLLMAGLVA